MSCGARCSAWRRRRPDSAAPGLEEEACHRRRTSWTPCSHSTRCLPGPSDARADPDPRGRQHRSPSSRRGWSRTAQRWRTGSPSASSRPRRPPASSSHRGRGFSCSSTRRATRSSSARRPPVVAVRGGGSSGFASGLPRRRRRPQTIGRPRPRARLWSSPSVTGSTSPRSQRGLHHRGRTSNRSSAATPPSPLVLETPCSPVSRPTA